MKKIIKNDNNYINVPNVFFQKQNKKIVAYFETNFDDFDCLFDNFIAISLEPS